MTARYPWPQFLKPLALDVVRVACDDVDVDVVRSTDERVHLEDAPTGWDEVKLDIELAATESRPEALSDVQLTAHVILSSSQTNTRIATVLEPSGPDRWKGVVRVHRAEIGGSMPLEAYLTAPDGDARPLLRGRSVPWTVVLDPGVPPAAPTSTPVISKWIDFAAADSPVLCRQYPSSPYAVLLDGAKPVLYLNQGLKGFQKLILAEHATLERRRLRDTFSTLIASGVTRALVQAAFDELVTNSEGSETPVPSEELLLRQSCEAVAEVMPSVSDVDELYVRMHSAGASLPELRALWSELDLAIGELVSLTKTVVTVAEEVRW